MRLTNYHREAFVNAVMNDVPEHDYDADAEALVTAYFYERMPADVRALYDGPNRSWLETHYVRTPCALTNVYVVYGKTVHNTDSEHPELWAKLVPLSERADAQSAEIKALRKKLEGVIASCTTLKQALQRLPEFEKYLPKETAATENLPAISNVVADLVKAGWPKDKACQPTA